MRQFRKILLVVAVLFSLILSVTVYLYLEKQAANKPLEDQLFTIYVAAVEIPERTLILENMLKRINIKDQVLYQDAINEPKDIVGKYAKETIFIGETFKQRRLMADLTDEISLKLTDTFRAMSLNVTQGSGVSDLVKVGDWIDVVVTLPELKEGERLIRPNISKIVLQHLEVIAVNRLRTRDETYNAEIVPSYTLTLSIPVFQVEQFVLAQSVGTLQVALRPYDSDTLYQTKGAIWEDLLVDDFGRIKDLFPQYNIDSVKDKASVPVEIEQYKYYTVKYGDSLRSIAKTFYGDENKFKIIQEVNQIEDENIISPGMAIKIPVLEKGNGG